LYGLIIGAAVGALFTRAYIDAISKHMVDLKLIRFNNQLPKKYRLGN
jgi:hypothetical protein